MSEKHEFNILNNIGFQLLKTSNNDNNCALSPLAILLNLNYLLQTTKSLDLVEKVENFLQLSSNKKGENAKKITDLIDNIVNGDLQFVKINLICGVCLPFSKSGTPIENIIQCEGKESIKEANDIISKCSENAITNLLTTANEPKNDIAIFGAMHLKAPFLNLFSTNGTEIKSFHVSSANEIKMPMMQYGSMIMYNSDEEVGIRMMRHYFYGGEFYVVIMVPTKRFALKEMENKLTNEKYVHLLESMRPVLGSISIPRMTIDFNIDLNSSFSSLGINLSAMESTLNSFAHGVSISFNEFGSHVPRRELRDYERCGPCLGGFTKPPEMQDIVADEPFLMTINYSKSNSMVAICRVLVPCATN